MHRAVEALVLLLLVAPSCGDPAAAAVSEATRAALAEAAAPTQWEDLDPARPGHRLRDPRTGIVFVRVPAGSFTMGGGEVPTEQPPHRVQLTKDYLLAETEVTIAQWQHHVQRNGGDRSVPIPKEEGATPMPVSWQQAQQYCQLYGYRLPTEAEWERACRGGLEAGAEPWRTDEGLVKFAWCHRNTKQVHAVATREPNPYGLFDMLGNVWEWCADGYAEGAYQGRPDPTVDPVTPEGNGRVLRGGSWFTTPTARAATRSAAQPQELSLFFGFRPARSLD